MRAVTILKKARALIKEKGWTQRAGARDAAGLVVFNGSPAAASYCAYGAMCAFSGNFDRALSALQLGDPDFSIIEWNDAPGRTKGQVLARFTRAINRLEKGKGGA